VPDFITKLKFKTMIQISNQKEKVVVNIQLSINWSIDLLYTRNCEMDAVLLRNQISNDLTEKIKKIRQDAYELGWKQAKAKKGCKKTWFNGNINSDYV